MTIGRITFNMFAKTFDRIMYETLQRVIRRKYFIQLAFSFSGIRTKFVSFILAGKEHVVSQSLQHLDTSIPNIGQEWWKNAGLNPSGPDALSECIYLIAGVNFSKD